MAEEDHKKYERGIKRMWETIMALPSREEVQEQLDMLRRDVYERIHGPGSYSELVIQSLNFLQNYSTLEDSIQDQFRSGAEDISALAATQASDVTSFDKAQFVVYQQSTRPELEFAAKMLRIESLDQLLDDLKPLSDEELGIRPPQP